MNQADVELWYRRYGPMVYRRCLSLLKNEAQAEEAMQEVFVKIWRRAEAMTDAAPSSYLYQTATHVSLNLLRARRRRPTSGEADLATLIAEATSAESAMSTRQTLTRLFSRRKAGTDVIAVLHYVDGMTLEEVAHEVGLSVSGVRKRLRDLSLRLEQPRRGELP